MTVTPLIPKQTRRTLSLTPLAHAVLAGYSYAPAYFRLRAAGLDCRTATALSAAGFDVIGAAVVVR